MNDQRGFLGNALGWLQGAGKTIIDAARDASVFVAGLPNEIIDFGRGLGEEVYQVDPRAQEQAVKFHSDKLLGEAGPFLLAGGAVLLIVLLTKK